MHLRYYRHLINGLDGANVVRRDPQTGDAPDIDLASLTGPVTITVVQTISGTSADTTPTAASPPATTLLGIPTTTQTTPASSSTTSLVPVSTEPSTPTSSPPTSSSPQSTPSSIPPATPTTQLQSSTAAASSASPSASGIGENAGASGSSSKLSSGGIAAIAFAIILVCFCAVFLIMRRRSRARTQTPIGSWSQSKTASGGMSAVSPVAALSPLNRNGTQYSRKPPSDAGSTLAVSLVEFRPPVPGLLTVRNGAPTPSISTIPPAPSRLSIPPASYNNSNADALTISESFISSQAAVGSAAAAPAPGTGVRTVICTYIVNLPDELPIKIGESIRVVAEYDDGWCLCTNSSGEQGMVPLECLQMGSTLKPTSSEYDVRRSRRASSLMHQ